MHAGCEPIQVRIQVARAKAIGSPCAEIIAVPGCSFRPSHVIGQAATTSVSPTVARPTTRAAIRPSNARPRGGSLTAKAPVLSSAAQRNYGPQKPASTPTDALGIQGDA